MQPAGLCKPRRFPSALLWRIHFRPLNHCSELIFQTITPSTMRRFALLTALSFGVFASPTNVNDVGLEKRQAQCSQAPIRAITSVLSRQAPAAASSFCSKFIKRTVATVTSTVTTSIAPPAALTTITVTVNMSIDARQIIADTRRRLPVSI